jgi:hypothetical protein
MLTYLSEQDEHVNGRFAASWKSSNKMLMMLCALPEQHTHSKALHAIFRNIKEKKSVGSWTRNVEAEIMIMWRKKIQYSRDDNSACKNPSRRNWSFFPHDNVCNTWGLHFNVFRT